MNSKPPKKSLFKFLLMSCPLFVKYVATTTALNLMQVTAMCIIKDLKLISYTMFTIQNVNAQ